MEEIEIANISSAAKIAVEVQNVFKRYTTRDIVLNGVTLTVPEGIVYCLLGPSGCGKTTLLKCILGSVEMDGGSITINVRKHTDIGYIPQFLEIHDNMTINENLYFYGYFFGMKTGSIKTRASELIKFLDLPSGDQQVNKLSGGQQRVVSMAVALVHDPILLILDEPTIGMDPILNQSIWDQLLEMTTKGKTVIISTHHVQEARQAHTVGLMRKGILLDQGVPSELIQNHICDDLEEVFLKLSHKQETAPNYMDMNFPKTNEHVVSYFEDDHRMFSIKRFCGITYKNFTMLQRDVTFLVVAFIFPMFLAYIFTIAIGRKPKNLPLAIVNEEIPIIHCPYSSSRSCYLKPDKNEYLSCLYLEFLRNKTYHLIEYQNVQKALQDARQNKVWGLLHFNQNYTLFLKEKIALGIRETNMKAIINSHILVTLDLSNAYIGNFVRHDLIYSTKLFIKEIYSACGYDPRADFYFSSTTIENVSELGSLEEDFTGYALSALLCLSCFFLPSHLVSSLLYSEKTSGIIERLMITGASVGEIMASIATVQILVQTVQIILTMVVLYVISDNPLHGSSITLFFLMMFTSTSGMLFGFIVPTLINKAAGIALCNVCLVLALSYSTGLFWPTGSQHPVLKYLFEMLPLKWIVKAARRIVSKNFSILSREVLLGFASIFFWNLAFILILHLILKWNKNLWIIPRK